MSPTPRGCAAHVHGGPVVLRPVRATPCSTSDTGRDSTGKVGHVIKPI